MVRPTIDLEQYKAQIIQLYQAGKNPAAIALFLHEEHDAKAHSRTVSSRLQAWGIRKYNPRTVRKESALLERIKGLFHEVGLKDKEILVVLQSEGFQINARTLRRVRTELGLVRRTDDPVQQQIQEETALQGLVQEIEAGTIEGYGKELLYRQMRQAGYAVPRFYSSLPLATLSVQASILIF